MKFTAAKYAEALAQTLETDDDPKIIIRNLLAALQRRKQFRLLPKILQAFEKQWAHRRGIFKIDVTYPEKFKDSLQEFEKNISAKIEKKLEMKAKPSKTLIGGFRVQADDTLIDASIESRLKTLARRLHN